MATKSIKKNYIYNLIYQVLLLITPLITTPYVSRVLKADGIGTYSYIESIVSYFVLFGTLGITTYGQREISYVQDNKEERTRIFWDTKILEVITGGVSLIIYLIFAFTRNNILYILYAFNILSVIFDVSWLFQGLEEFGKIVIRNIVFKLINIIFIFAFIKTKNDLTLYVFGITFFAFIGNLSLWFGIPKYVNKIDFSKLKPFSNIKVVISLFIPTIAIQIYTVLDKTMIGIITKSEFENGYYDQALKISKIVLTIVIALGTVMIPRVGSLFQNGQSEEIKKLMYKSYRFVWFLGLPLCFGLIMCAGNFVPWFFGDGYDKVVNLLGILSFLILAIGINNVTGMQYLIPTKRQNTFTLTVCIGAIVNFCLNALLIPKYQSIGAAVGSVAAETTIAVVQIIIVRNELHPIEIIKQSFHYVLACFLMVVVLYFESKYLTSSIINTFIMVISGATVYFVVLLIIKDDFFLSNIDVVLRKLKIRKA